MRVEPRAVEALKPYERNARVHSKSQVDRIARSIEAFGFRKPVVVDEAGLILAGHGAVLAARQLKMSEVPCAIAEGLTEEQKHAYVLADNKIAEESTWDTSMLGLEFGNLIGKGFDLSLTGFNIGEIDRVLGTARAAGKTDPDAAPETPSAPVSQVGDLWHCGEHRVICGDSTSPAVLEQLAGADRAAVLFTDPPYGVSYRDTGAGAWDEKKLAKKKAGTLKPRFAAIANDEMTGVELAEFWAKFLAAALERAMDKRAAVYCCYASLRAPEVFAAFAKAGVEPRAELIWAKSRPGFNFAQYKHQHEPILYGVRKGKPAPWYGDDKQTTLLEVASEPGSAYLHPTQKPVGLLERPLGNSSKPGQYVLDPFLGSGTTLIACERLQRRCLGIELAPAYVDVAVRRWQAYTGKEALLVEGDKGATFDTIARVRGKVPSQASVH